MNASALCAALLPEAIAGARLVKERLSVSFASSHVEAMEAVARHRPDLVIALGQAPRSEVCLERVALNIMHSAKPDNDGFMPRTLRIVAGAPDGLFTPVPVDALCAQLQQRGFQCRVSNTAGTYVCNYVYFNLLWEKVCRRRGALARCPVLFVHVPQNGPQAHIVVAKLIRLMSLKG